MKYTATTQGIIAARRAVVELPPIGLPAKKSYGARAVADLEQADVAFALGRWAVAAAYLRKAGRWARLAGHTEAERFIGDLWVEAAQWEATPKDWDKHVTTARGFFAGELRRAA